MILIAQQVKVSFDFVAAWGGGGSFIKVLPEGLMVDMALKNISSFTVSYTPLPMKTDLHFQPTLPWLQNFQRTSIQLFFAFLKTLRNCVALT